jgi:hexosaminidase
MVEFAISEDGKQFNTVGRFESPVQPQKGTAYIRDFSQDFEKQPARFVKVIAGNTGVCPDWHPGAGGKAWLFSDEIVVR